jgi:UDP-N-acetylglucosamine 2-epimerase (non-hydrolysing)
MAPVVKLLERTQEIEPLICVTAQHREMLDQVLNLFQIHPDYDLNLMRANQSLGSLTAEIFSKLDPLLTEIVPDWILVQGDTTTVMAASLLAYYHRIKVAHLEAGLRTGDKWQPFPEEINRRIAGVTADLHFAPTSVNRDNLLHEGVEDWRIHVTGNTIVDALYAIRQHAPPDDIHNLLMDLGVTSGSKKLILVTAHRRENFGRPLEEICAALKQLAVENEQIEIIYPVHLNPNVQGPVHFLLDGVKNIHLLEPQNYLPMVHLMRNASIILTDSGGIQEEATALNIPTLVLREVTERPEGIQAGILKLVGTVQERIVAEAGKLLENIPVPDPDTIPVNPYGDGHSAERIVQILLQQRDLKQEAGTFHTH